MSRRSLMRLIATGAGGALIAACAAPPTPTPLPSKPAPAPTQPPAAAPATQRPAPVTITYWRQQRGKGEEEGTTEYAQQFKATAGHTVQVSYIAGSEMGAKVVSAFAAGTAPDLLLVGVGAPQYTAQNLLAEVPADLASFIKEKAFPAEESATLWKGKRYTVPLDASDLVLGYRVKMLQDAGVDTSKTPADWDELIQWILKATKHDASGKIVQAGFDTVFNNWETTAVIGAAGGKWWRSLDKLALSSPEVVAAYDFYRSLTWTHKASTINWMASDQYGNAFTLGKAAMLLAGPWTITTMRNDAPGVEWRSFPMPSRKKGDPPGTVLGGYHVSVNAKSTAPDQSWEFVRLMTTRDNRVLWINKTARVSPYNDLADVKFFEGDPNYEQMNKALAVANEGHGTPPSPAEPEVAQALQVAMERAWVKGEESLKALTEEEAKVLPVFLKKNKDAGAI